MIHHPLRALAMSIAAATILLATVVDAHAQTTLDASRIGSVPVPKRIRTLRDLRFQDIVQQKYDFSCGTAALATLLRHGYGYDTASEQALIRSMLVGADPQQVVRNGFSMLDMKRHVERIGLKGQGFRVDADALYRLRMPVITLVDVRGYKHFVVVKGAEAGRVFVADPALGHRVVPEKDFKQGWNGIIFAVLADRPLQQDSALVSHRTSPALMRRLDALEQALAPAPIVELGLVRHDLF